MELIIQIIYIIIICILFYIAFRLNKEVRREYYRKDLDFFPAGKFLFFPFIFPRDYFRKDRLWKAYTFYLVMQVVILLAVYLLCKLAGLV